MQRQKVTCVQSIIDIVSNIFIYAYLLRGEINLIEKSFLRVRRHGEQLTPLEKQVL